MNVDIQQGEQTSSYLDDVPDTIGDEAIRLRRHIGPGDTPGLPSSITPTDSVPLFLIERAPWSPRGAACKLPTCSNRIKLQEYRVAFHPGMSGAE